ncbi:MAG: VanW family protein [Anaerolineaceae bacterium]|jgi:vancomycin resistance protein YoaR
MGTQADNLNHSPYSLRRQVVFALGMGLLIALIVIISAVYVFERKHAQTIYPGVNVSGVDLSNQTLGEALANLNAAITYPNDGKLMLTDGNQQWLFSPNQLGFSLNMLSAADRAYQVGRQGNLITNLSTQLYAANQGYRLEPEALYDQRVAFNVLQEIAREVDVPVIEAAVGVNGTEVVVQEGKTGYQIDITATLTALEKHLFAKQDGIIPLVINTVEPKVKDVSDTAEMAKRILSAPLVMSMPEGDSIGPWQIEPQDLTKIMVVQRRSNHELPGYEISINQEALRSYLISISPAMVRHPKNARMDFDPDTGTMSVIENAVVGHEIDLERSLQAVIDSLAAGEHNATLVMQLVEPQVKDDTVPASLGIRELVASETTYFYGASADRVQNIRLSSANFHGVMVPPGAVFSMAEYLKDISLDNGYAEAPIIVGDQTIKGVGGGICQVSTTLFRTVFFGGFPIVERHPHAYRVGYYEQLPNGRVDTNLAGLDASVFVPIVDFKFKNDTPYWILMETTLEGYSLRWDFYSTKDGRSMDWSTSGLTNIKEPPEPVYRFNSSLAEGEIKQVDWAVNGATVNVKRTVTKDGKIYFQDQVNTVYVPWPDGFDYGPNTDLGDKAHTP